MPDKDDMPYLRFPFDEVAALVDHTHAAGDRMKGAPEGADVVLVGDQGVYFMSLGRPLPQEDGKTKVVYAVECNPDKNEDWWDVKSDTFGGDDGVEYCDIKSIIDAGRTLTPLPEFLIVAFSPEALHFEVRKPTN
jgi:Protein of unknown function (DUF3085)